jgi:hypothetical protein
MNSSSPKGRLPSKKNLENYANAYMGAYMSVVEKERPEHMPALVRNAPYDIEVSLLPNQCFAMLFERADKQGVTVQERDWSHVESKVMSGVAHMVVVYAHEGPTVADAISKGKKDAVRDIRALEDSNLAKAVSQLEKILGDLTSVEKGNKSLLKVAELELSRLQPIKDAIKNSGPEVDMLAMLDAVKNYPTSPVEVNIDFKEKALLEHIAKDLGDMSDVIRRVESQDQRLEEIEQSMTKTLSEFGRTIDEKVGKGLAVVLSSSDRKIDKGVSAIQDIVARTNQDSGTVKDLDKRLKAIEDIAAGEHESKNVSKEVLLAIADLRQEVDRVAARTTKVEQFLVQLTRPKVAQQK